MKWRSSYSTSGGVTSSWDAFIYRTTTERENNQDWKFFPWGLDPTKRKYPEQETKNLNETQPGETSYWQNHIPIINGSPIL